MTKHEPMTTPKAPSLTAVLREQLYTDLKPYKEALAQDPENATVSDALGLTLLKVADFVLSNRRWRGYAWDLKEDMKSRAMMRCMRGCQLVKMELGPQKVFSYFTRIIWLAFSVETISHKEEVNRHYRYIYDCLTARGVSHLKACELLGGDPTQPYNSHVVKSTAKWKGGYKSEAKRKREAEEAKLK